MVELPAPPSAVNVCVPATGLQLLGADPRASACVVSSPCCEPCLFSSVLVPGLLPYLTLHYLC